MARVLVVEDEANLLTTIAYNLRHEGYEVQTAADGAEALEEARRYRPELVILDIMLPKIDGLEVCRRLRRESAVPILMLSARSEEIDRVIGLEIGADDYLSKPFSMRELLARTRAMLRRAQLLREELSAREAVADVGQRLTGGEIEIDLTGHRVWRRGEEVPLKPKEFDLLVFLVRHRGQVCPPEQLLTQVWGYSYSGDARTVAVHIRGLREKIEDDPANPVQIETVRGVGYRFA